MTKEGQFTFCVSAIIENPNGEILILKRSPDNHPGNIWDVVGGGVESLENPFDALKREIEEETGINDLRIIKAINDFYWYQPETSQDMIGVNFWCKTNQLAIQLSDEHTEFKWLLPEEALKIQTHQLVHRCFKKFIEEKQRIGV